MEYTINEAFILAGPLVAILVGIGKKLGWVPCDRILKQVTALVVSCIVVMLWPILQGQPLPDLWPLVVSGLQTWIASMGVYAVYNTGQKAVEEANKPHS